MFFKCGSTFYSILEPACRHDPRPNFHSTRTDLMLIRKQPNNVRPAIAAAIELWILFIPKGGERPGRGTWRTNIQIMFD